MYLSLSSGICPFPYFTPSITLDDPPATLAVGILLLLAGSTNGIVLCCPAGIPCGCPFPSK